MSKELKILISFMVFSLFLWGIGNSSMAFFIKNHKPIDDGKSSINMFAMDTYISVTAYGGQSGVALKKVESKIRELESLWSVTNVKSEIYTVNHHEGRAVSISSITAQIIRFSLQMAEQTSGALDLTIYPIVTSWGFTTGNYKVPSSEEIEQRLKYVGYEKIKLQEDKIQLPEGVQIDLGAVAKGYICDIVADILHDDGITSALIDLGGNIKVIGTKPNGNEWKIGIKAPERDGYLGTVEIVDSSIVTSGRYERCFRGADGKQYWHIMNPRTGKPAESGIVSVSVIGKESKLCDALSTALFVMGLEKATQYWRKYGDFEFVLLTDRNELYITAGLENKFSLHEDYRTMQVNIIPK